MFDRKLVPSGSQARRRGAYPSPRPEDRSIPLIADRAYDSDPLRERLKQSKWDLICPYRRSRKRAKTQDGRKLRRYR